MTTDLTIFKTFPKHARTWVYQSSRQLTPDEAGAVCTIARDFAAQWKAHGQPLKATADVLYDRFLVMMVDEDAAGASGCSIDSSVAFVRSLGTKLNADFFDRMQLAYIAQDGEVRTVHANRIAQAVDAGEMSATTIVFNNMVTSHGELQDRWCIPLSESWAASRAGVMA
ncbi:MAG: ABC transporter ATPase [Flavobacteriales bacterium]|nr:ABC transporter ATPase [Flavobacteriales bacterium]